MPRILCIWLCRWPLQRVLAERPELRGRPVVLSQPHPRGGERVVDASRAAIAMGIRVGMTLAEAAALARRSNRGKKNGEWGMGNGEIRKGARTAICDLPFDPIADRLALVGLAHWCQRFSPTVGLEEAERPESLLLDVTGMDRLLGKHDRSVGERRLLAPVIKDFRAIGYHVRAAIGETVGAAWAKAHSGISDFPLTALRLPAQTVDLLNQLGVERVDQLAALPRQQLRSRFGPLLLLRLDQALGRVAEAIDPVRPALDLSAHQSFAGATTDYDVLCTVLDKLITQLAKKLAAAGEGATELICRLDVEDTLPRVLDVRLYRPCAMARHLFELAHMQLEQTSLSRPVEGITVTVTATAPLIERQQMLFADAPEPGDSVQLASLIDRLAGRLGHRAIVRPRLVRDAQPELAARYDVQVGATGLNNYSEATVKSSRTRKTKTGLHHPLQRPLMLLCEPYALVSGDAADNAFSNGAPEARHGGLPTSAYGSHAVPQRFTYRGRLHEVVGNWGPERIETGWWRRRGIRRDYWRVQTGTGGRYWIFRRLHDGKWFLHGEF